MKEITVEAKLENLDKVQDFISNELKSVAGDPVKLQTQISLAAEEIFVNIARYAYGKNVSAKGSPSEQPLSEIGAVTVRVAVGKDIIIEFEDSGKPFNPLEISDPNISLSIEERRIGGLGIFLVKKLMDDIKYRYKDNKNILILIKKSDYPLKFPVGEIRW